MSNLEEIPVAANVKKTQRNQNIENLQISEIATAYSRQDSKLLAQNQLPSDDEPKSKWRLISDFMKTTAKP